MGDFNYCSIDMHSSKGNTDGTGEWRFVHALNEFSIPTIYHILLHVIDSEKGNSPHPTIL